MAYAPSASVIATPIGRVGVESDGDVVTRVVIGCDEAPNDSDVPLTREAAAQLRAYFDGRLDDFDLPLAPAATERRGAIWQAMRAVGAGDVATYGDIAARTGSIARAVGQACRHNPLPILIPCHRILQAGNRLGPYSAGAGPDTKRWLLTHERAGGWLL